MSSVSHYDAHERRCRGLRHAFLSPGAFLDVFFSSTCSVILLSIMAGMTKKKNILFHLSKVISRMTALHQRRHHPREKCVHSHHVCVTSVFWCASIINNVLNVFLGDAGCQGSPSDAAAAVGPGECYFPAAFSLWFRAAPSPSLVQTVCIFLFCIILSLPYLWPHRCSLYPCGKPCSPPLFGEDSPSQQAVDVLAQMCNAAGNVYPQHVFV